jgi:hypothetical protein
VSSRGKGKEALRSKVVHFVDSRGGRQGELGVFFTPHAKIERPFLVVGGLAYFNR